MNVSRWLYLCRVVVTPVRAWMALVRSRICFESSSSSRFCLSSSCTVIHCWLAITCRFASARFWLIITKVERKIASSDTIIVSSPYG